MGNDGEGAPPTTSASPEPRERTAEKGSRNGLPKFMTKLTTDNIGTLSPIKAFKAEADVKVSDLAQLNISQHRAIGKRGKADVGDSGIRRERTSFLEKMPLSSKLKEMPLCLSSPLTAWIKGERRAGQVRI